MPVESATYLNSLVVTNPLAGDPRSEGDDHFRLMKSVLKATFPGRTAAQYLEWCGQAGGTADALTLTPATAIGAYALGTVYRFSTVASNTGAVTLNISGLGVRAVKFRGAELSAGMLLIGQYYEVVDDGTYFALLTPHGAEVVVDDGSSGSIFKTVQGFISGFIGTIRATNTSFAAALAAAGDKTLIVSSTINITSNTTVPSNVTLKVERGGLFAISAGVTLTINGAIDAGFYRIFSFADATSVVSTADPASWDAAANSLNAHYEIKVDWFGAVPDGVAPLDRVATPNGVPSGTDSSDGFRRAMLFAQTASLKGGGTFIYTPYVKVAFAPNGTYRVRGDNILGIQNTGLGGGRVIYEGNGANLLHEVLTGTDALIKNAAYLYRPIFRDFSVDPFNANGTSRQGYFLTTDSPVGTVQFDNPQMRNVRVAMGFSNRGYADIFTIDGTTMCDNGKVRDCEFGTFNRLFRCTNGEAVNWLFDKCDILPATDNSVMFDFDCNFSGTLNVTNCEMALSGAAPLILRTQTTGTPTPNAKWSFSNNRCEERQECDTSHFDVSYGVVEFDGTNFLAGALASGGARTGNKRIAIIRGNAMVRLKNVFMQTNQVTIQSNTLGSSGRTEGLYTENCGFQSEYKTANALGTGLKYYFLDSAGAASDMDSALASAGWKNIEHGYLHGSNGKFDYPHKIIKGQGTRQTVRISTTRTADGKATANVFTELPSYIVITSVKLYAEAWLVADIDRISFFMSNQAAGVLSANAVVLAGTAVSGQELLATGKHITTTDVDYVLMGALWGLGGAFVMDVDKMPNSYLEVTYEGVSKAYQLPALYTSSYYIHNKIE
jgi:hypothetical protein